MTWQTCGHKLVRMTFSPGLLEELKRDYPRVDVDDVAIAVERAPDVKNPDGLLVAWVQRRNRLPEGEDFFSPAPKNGEFERPPAAGGFAVDGSWDPSGDGRERVTLFVWSLVRHRRDGASPKEIAERAGSSEFAGAFNPDTLEDWLARPSRYEWTFARYSRASESTIRTAGRGHRFTDSKEYEDDMAAVPEEDAAPEVTG